MAARRDARAYVDEAGGSLGRDGPWRRVCGLQPAGRAAWRGQGGVGELADADGAAQTGAGQHPVSRNAFCRVADCSASRVSPAFPDRRDLSWSTAGRSPASAQRVFRTRVVLHATNLEETFVGVLRRGRRRTGARPGGLSAPRFRVRVAHGAVVDHLQDSTHTSFGVLTTGLVVDRFK